MQVQLGGVAYILDVASGGRIPFYIGCFLIYVLVAIYVWLGGLRSVAWANIVQGAIFISFSFILGTWLLSLAGGLNIFPKLVQEHPILFTEPGYRKIWNDLMLWLWALPVGMGWIYHPHIWIPVYGTKDKRFLYVWPLFMTLAWVDVILVQGYASAMAGWILPHFKEPDKVLITMVYKFLPWAVFIIVAIGAISAMASSLNAQVFSLGTVTSNDIMGKTKLGVPSEKVMLYARIGMVIYLFFGFLKWFIYPALLGSIRSTRINSWCNSSNSNNTTIIRNKIHDKVWCHGRCYWWIHHSDYNEVHN